MTDIDGRIAVVTDSTSELLEGNAAGVRVVPLHLHFGEEQFTDGAEMTKEAFWARLTAGGDGANAPHPSTSQPSAAAFRDVYAELAAAGAAGIVSIHISGALSGTLNSAEQGAALLDGGPPVRAIDSRTTSWELGWAALAAAGAAGEGGGIDAVAAAAEESLRRSHLMLFVETLDYLLRGGRIGRARHLAGKLLRVRPLLELADGEVSDAARPRTRAKAIEALLRRIEAARPQRVRVMHGACAADAEALAERVRRAGIDDVDVALGSTILGAHTGPGTLGAALLRSPA